MTRHFLYLVACGIRNGARRQARRLRQPRYLVAALLGALYFFFIFGGWMAGDEAADAVGGPWLSAGRRIGPLILGLLASWWWLRGGHRQGLTLSPAEAHFLLTAPLTRRDIVRYKVLQAQPPAFISALIGTLVMRGTELLWPLRLLSLWVLIATLHQHQLASSLVNAAAQEQGRTGLRKQLVPMLLFTSAFVVLLWSVLRALADVRATPSMAFAAERVSMLLDETGPRIVLAPFRLLLAPTVATSVAAWLPAFGAALVVLLLHYLWVQRTDAAFEEAAAEEGARRHERMEAVRAGGLSRMRFTRLDRPKRLARPWLPLRSTGRAAYAILWKNVLYVQRSFRALSLLFPLFLLGMIIMVGAGDGGMALVRDVAVVCLIFGGLTTIAGPLAFRNDLRMDLAYVDQLRTYPLAGRDLVAAEVAAAAATVSVPQLVLVITGLILSFVGGTLSGAELGVMSAGALLALPILNALAVTIQNGIALLYPEWSRIGARTGGGMETIGQEMLTLVATLLLLAVCAIPPVVVGTLIGAPLALQFGDLALPFAIAAGAAAVAVEVVLLVRWLGRLYDNTDPAAAGLLR